MRSAFNYTRIFAGALLLALLSTAAPAYAQSCDGVSAAIDDEDAAVRLDFLRDRMHRGAKYASIWDAGWSVAYAGVSTYEAIALPLADHHDRIDRSFGLGGSLLGLAVLQIMPMKIIGDDRRLERFIAASPDGGRCTQLAEAERLLQRDAASEAFSHGPLVHVGNFILNSGMALALGFGFHHWDAAAIQGLSGIAIGEVQTFTQPSYEQKTLRHYQRGESAKREEKGPSFVSITPIFDSQQRSLLAGFSF
jgi:hypothetical protein